MAKRMTLLLFVGIIFWECLASQVFGHTDELDRSTLHGLYEKLNKPPQLSKWKLHGGDPCQDGWIGVECEGTSVVNLKLHGLKLSTNIIGVELATFKNLKQLDLSSNMMRGRFPSLPRFLISLNVSHNELSGPLSRVFTQSLPHLRVMDISYNKFRGDLPDTSTSMPRLRKLFLKGNQVTGSVNNLENLILNDLIPQNQFNIKNLRTSDNQFSVLQNASPPISVNASSPISVNASAAISGSSAIAKPKGRAIAIACLVVLIIVVYTILRIYHSFQRVGANQMSDIKDLHVSREFYREFKEEESSLLMLREEEKMLEVERGNVLFIM